MTNPPTDPGKLISKSGTAFVPNELTTMVHVTAPSYKARLTSAGPQLPVAQPTWHGLVPPNQQAHT